MTETQETPPPPPTTETPANDSDPAEAEEAEETDEPADEKPEPETEDENEATDEGEEAGITDSDSLPENPLNDPGKDLERLVERGINDDLWKEAVGELPCTSATTECISQLQNLAATNNALIKEIDARIEEVNERIEDARVRNKRSIKLSMLTPALRAVLDYQPPAQTTTGPDGKPVQQTKRQSFFPVCYS